LAKNVYQELKVAIEGVDHPNIVQTYELLHDAHHFYIVQEYCEHGDLYWHFNKFNELQARDISRQLLKGISYLHEKKIVHRDIKLENVVVHSIDDLGNYKIKLIDFGLS